MIRTSAATLALAAALGLAACGGDDAEPAAAPAAGTAAAGDVERYCELGRRLDAAGERHFRALGRDATPEQFEAAERSFVERYADELRAIERSAPRPIRADVRTLLAAQRQRAGIRGGPAVGERQASAAEERIQAFERRECGERG